MRRRAIVLLVALGGCDKLFDLTEVVESSADSGTLIDAPLCPPVVMHDEDDDGVDDSCDACPTVPNDATDEDADGLPDQCDPSIATKDRIAFYASFDEDDDLARVRSSNVTRVSPAHGAAAMASSALLEIAGPLSPTRIVANVRNVKPVTVGALFTIAVLGVTCKLNASQCNVSTPGTCVSVTTPTTLSGSSAAALTLLDKVVFDNGSPPRCDATVGAIVTGQGGVEFPTASVQLHTNNVMSLELESVVVYARK